MKQIAAAAVTLVVLAGCSRDKDSPAGGPASKPTVNVVILLIDTLRADRLGCYGYAKPTSPRIDELAKESVLFERASAPAPWTLASVPSLLTSKLPCEHRVLVDGDLLDPSHTTLAERLKPLGYQTYSFYHNPYAGPTTGLHRGFDVSLLTVQEGDTNGAFLSSFFERNPATPFFLYVHNTEPHNPYEALDRLVQMFGGVSQEDLVAFKRRTDVYRRLTRTDSDARRALGTTDNSARQKAALDALDALRPQADILYDAVVREADENAGSIIDTLKARGVWDNTLFILTADHGEEMGEHGGWQHDQSAYEELLHVPLIIHFPRGEQAGRRVKETVGLIDVVPTVLDVLNRSDLSKGDRGRSLLPLASGKAWRPATEPVVYATRINKKKFYKPWKEKRGDYNVVVHQGDWKLIYNVEPKSVELYNLATDSGELNDLSVAQAERAGALRQFAESFVAHCEAGAKNAGRSGRPATERGRLTAEERRLKQLGYAGGDDDEEDDSHPTASQPAASQPARP